MQGVDEVKSVSQPGLSTVTVKFTIQSTPGYDELYQRFAQMRAKVSDAQGRLPPNALESQVYDDFGDVYALYYAVTGEGWSLPELHDYAQDLQRELVTVDGVSKVVLSGVQDEVVYVEYVPSRLVELGLTPGQIAQLLEGQNFVIPGGAVVAGELRMEIRPTGGLTSVEALEDLLISDPSSGTSFRLGDVAEVSRGLAELEPDRPLGIDVMPISDQSVTVKASVDNFVVNVIMALAIVIGTLLVFMGLRSGILMGGILLVTVAGTLFGMYLYGLDMQRISLGALIIALGMLVDNAIVVVEGALVRVQKGESAASASRAIVEQTKWPLLGGTIVGILAFSPIGFSPDNTGEYASSLFWTIAISLLFSCSPVLLFSWLVAVWLTPYFCTLLLKPDPNARPKGENIILRGYRKLLALAIRVRWITVGLVVALLLSAVAMFSQVPPGFFRPQPGCSS